MYLNLGIFITLNTSVEILNVEYLYTLNVYRYVHSREFIDVRVSRDQDNTDV